MLWFSRNTLSGSHWRFNSTSRCHAESPKADRTRSELSSPRKLGYAAVVCGSASAQRSRTQAMLSVSAAALRLASRPPAIAARTAASCRLQVHAPNLTCALLVVTAKCGSHTPDCASTRPSATAAASAA